MATNAGGMVFSQEDKKSEPPVQYVDVVTREIIDGPSARRLYPEYTVGAPKKLRYRCDLLHRMPGLCGAYGLVNLKYRAVRTTHTTRHCQRHGSRAGFNTPSANKRLPRSAALSAEDLPLPESPADGDEPCGECESDEGADPASPDQKEERESGEAAEAVEAGEGQAVKKQKVWAGAGLLLGEGGGEAVSLTPPESSVGTPTCSDRSDPTPASSDPSEKHGSVSHQSTGTCGAEGLSSVDSPAVHPSNKRSRSASPPAPPAPVPSPPVKKEGEDKPSPEAKPAEEDKSGFLPPTSEERWKGACFYSLSDALHAALLTMPDHAGTLKSIYEVLLRMGPTRLVTTHEKPVSGSGHRASLMPTETTIFITASHNWRANIRTTFTRHKARFEHVPDTYGMYRLSAAAAKQIPPVIENYIPPAAPGLAPKAFPMQGQSWDAILGFNKGLGLDSMEAELLSMLATEAPAPALAPLCAPLNPDMTLDLQRFLAQHEGQAEASAASLQDLLGMDALEAPVSAAAPVATLSALQALMATQGSAAPLAPQEPLLPAPALGMAAAPMQGLAMQVPPLGAMGGLQALHAGQLEQLLAEQQAEQLLAVQMHTSQMHTSQMLMQAQAAAPAPPQAMACNQELEELNLPMLDLEAVGMDAEGQPGAAQAGDKEQRQQRELNVTKAIVQGALAQLGTCALQTIANSALLFSHGHSSQPDSVPEYEDKMYMRRLLSDETSGSDPGYGGRSLIGGTLSILSSPILSVLSSPIHSELVGRQAEVLEEPVPWSQHWMEYGHLHVTLQMNWAIFCMQWLLIALISLMGIGVDFSWIMKAPLASVARVVEWSVAQWHSMRRLYRHKYTDLVCLDFAIQSYVMTAGILFYVATVGLGSLPNLGSSLSLLPYGGRLASPHAAIFGLWANILYKMKYGGQWQQWVVTNPCTAASGMAVLVAGGRIIFSEVLAWVESMSLRIALPALWALLLVACDRSKSREDLQYSILMLVLAGMIKCCWNAQMAVGCWGYDEQHRDEVLLDVVVSVLLPIALLYSRPMACNRVPASAAS